LYYFIFFYYIIYNIYIRFKSKGDAMKKVYVTVLLMVSMALASGAIARNNNAAASQCNGAGLYCLESGNYQKASEYFIDAIQLNPANKFYYNNCAVAWMNMGRYEDAMDMLQIALAIDPHYVKALTNMAIVCFHLLKFSRAYYYYSQARTADSIYTKERFQMAKVIAGVKRVYARHPDNNDLQQILNQLEILQQRKKDLP